MTPVIITHPVMVPGGGGILVIEPGAEPVEIGDVTAADLIRHGLAEPVAAPADTD